MTIDDLKALAEKARAWRMWHHCDAPRCTDYRDGNEPIIEDCGTCDCCLGAKRACEDIAEGVDTAIEFITDKDAVDGGYHHAHAVNHAIGVSIIASYFGSESNPVAEFAAAVREFCSK